MTHTVAPRATRPATQVGGVDGILTDEQVREFVREQLAAVDLDVRSVCVLVPDGMRSHPGRRASVPARGGGLLRRQQVLLPRNLQSGGHQRLALARHVDDQCRDHRQPWHHAGPRDDRRGGLARALDPAEVDAQAWAADPDTLVAPRAGEDLFRLR